MPFPFPPVAKSLLGHVFMGPHEPIGTGGFAGAGWRGMSTVFSTWLTGGLDTTFFTNGGDGARVTLGAVDSSSSSPQHATCSTTIGLTGDVAGDGPGEHSSPSIGVSSAVELLWKSAITASGVASRILFSLEDSEPTEPLGARFNKLIPPARFCTTTIFVGTSIAAVSFAGGGLTCCFGDSGGDFGAVGRCFFTITCTAWFETPGNTIEGTPVCLSAIVISTGAPLTVFRSDTAFSASSRFAKKNDTLSSLRALVIPYAPEALNAAITSVLLRILFRPETQRIISGVGIFFTAARGTSSWMIGFLGCAELVKSVLIDKTCPSRTY
mmetsp:Transcript_20089/g.33174  ORF Transcript_20089/g.33174 Transcript_20089/m.33174 type:complete len:325 (-) Transcript_20089:1288-2262(-)